MMGVNKNELHEYLSILSLREECLNSETVWFYLSIYFCGTVA
jgi:hypothetical protein